MAYFTITVAPGLDPAQHRRAVYAGPRAVSSRRPQSELLRHAGFVDVVASDVTAEYRRTEEAYVAAHEQHRDELRAPDPAAFDQRLGDNRLGLAAIREGLLQRWLLVARRPDGT